MAAICLLVYYKVGSASLKAMTFDAPKSFQTFRNQHSPVSQWRMQLNLVYILQRVRQLE